MRNIGASMGISAVTTMQFRQMQAHINILGGHVNSSSPAAQQTFRGLEQVFMSRGADAVTAAHQAEGAVWGMVLRQASMLSYNDVFRFLGAMFLVLLPLLFLMKKPKGGKGPSMAH
jgi:DHA2 family multidrug resistance protein